VNHELRSMDRGLPGAGTGRSRVFPGSCSLAAIALTAYGLHRWPVERVTTYRNSGSEFVRSADPVDRVLGTAD
jgi:hypothetical protein